MPHHEAVVRSSTWAVARWAQAFATAAVFVAFMLAKPQVRSRKAEHGASFSLVIFPFRGLPIGIGVEAGRVQLGDTVIDIVGVGDGSINGQDGKA